MFGSSQYSKHQTFVLVLKLLVSWNHSYHKCALEGNKYKKIMDRHNFSDNSNSDALFSVGNKLEKSAEKSLQITQIQVVLIFLSQKPANNKIQKFIFSLNFIMEMNLYLVASYAKGKNLNHSIARPNFCSAPFKVTLLEIPESPEEYREKLLAKLHRCRSNRT